MSELLSIMLNVLGPVFIIVALMIFIARRFNPDPRGLSTLLIYVFVPALAFDGIAQSDLRGDELLGIAGVAIGISIVMALVGLLLARVFRFDRRLESAFLISIILMNAANYGIPVNGFAFGPAGSERAIIYYVMSVMAGSVLGVYFASRGTASVQQAFLNVLKVPITHAAVLGILVNVGDVTLPEPLANAISILADAAVPGMLALLGLQLARTSLYARWGPILLASGTRLILGPLLAVPLALLLGLSGVSFQVAIVESAMPTAVMANALATEFDSDAEFTAAATLVSTVLSIITLTVLLSLLS